jgi:hypothetical protein
VTGLEGPRDRPSWSSELSSTSSSSGFFEGGSDGLAATVADVGGWREGP